MRFPEPIYVTRPTMPDFESYVALLRGVWKRKQLTNSGPLEDRLEERLKEYLGIEHISLLSSGTTALMVALEALGIRDGEVITTPFTFPATVNALRWKGITPVFCDIDPETFNIDPAGISRCISRNTRAILGVHVYGRPCDVDAIDWISRENEIPVIYDAAHAFGVKHNGRSILKYGYISALSFHATKIFATCEGGAIVSGDEFFTVRANRIRNFGIDPCGLVIDTGINGKMSELHAAFGLLQLDAVEQEIAKRKTVASLYRDLLSDVPGIKVPDYDYCAYFPIICDDRDGLCNLLAESNVFARKYFYPALADLPAAKNIADKVLCLPIYGDLSLDSVHSIAEIVSSRVNANV